MVKFFYFFQSKNSSFNFLRIGEFFQGGLNEFRSVNVIIVMVSCEKVLGFVEQFYKEPSVGFLVEGGESLSKAMIKQVFVYGFWSGIVRHDLEIKFIIV